jgi:ATP-dependent Clp protease protease subunit
MSSSSKDTVFDLLIDHGIDIRGRILYLQGEVDEDMYNKFVKLLKYLDKTTGDIEIVLNSCGGCVTSGFAMYDAIKACNNPVTIKCYGAVMSIASLILQAADKRIISENCRMMIHRGETALAGDFNIVKKAMQEEMELDRMLCDVYFDRMTDKNPEYKRAALEKLMDTDSYFSAEKALELGLIDEIEGDEA